MSRLLHPAACGHCLLQAVPRRRSNIRWAFRHGRNTRLAFLLCCARPRLVLQVWSLYLGGALLHLVSNVNRPKGHVRESAIDLGMASSPMVLRAGLLLSSLIAGPKMPSDRTAHCQCAGAPSAKVAKGLFLPPGQRRLGMFGSAPYPVNP